MTRKIRSNLFLCCEASVAVRFLKWPVTVLILSFMIPKSYSQNTATVKGVVLNDLKEPVSNATISMVGGQGTFANEKGEFVLVVPADRKVQIEIRYLGYAPKVFEFTLEPEKIQEISVTLETVSMKVVEISEEKDRELGLVTFDPENVQMIATPGDPLISLLRSAGLGIMNSDELTAGYSVRGGNYDENLIYVNDVEIYRPFLARSGQQEGLSLINPDMIQSLSFSSGGFEAKYGDKMSSVLDITYKKPVRFAASAMGSFLGATFHVEDAIFKNRLKYVTGFRFKSNNYVLSGLDTKADYQPHFIDYQAFVTYDASEKFEVSFMGAYSDNNYRVVPHNRETVFGHVQEAKKLTVYFDGQEVTRFQVGSGALTFNFKPTNNQSHKLIGSFYRTIESEKFDISGEYFLGEIEGDLGSPSFGEVTNTVGVGGFLNHARNTLQATVFAAEVRDRIFRESKKNHRNSITFQWGAKYQHEQITDKLREWSVLDSSGYALPYFGYTDTFAIELEDVKKTEVSLASNRAQAYFQQSHVWWTDSNRIYLTAGIRIQYWDLNQDVLVSPRVQLAWKPKWKADFMFRLSSGIYYQAPFYRELRDLDGHVHTDVKAQRSIHAVAGMDYNFKIWNRPFKLVAEAYYKYLDQLNPYKLDNVRIRYYAVNNATGYAAGVDFKLNGEFIEGLDSWVTMSLMQTQEDIQGDFYITQQGDTVFPGFIPRPTDQAFSLGLFFQDHLPKIKFIRVHLNLLFGSRLPFGPPGVERYADTLRAPFYRRVDIGFSYVILAPDRVNKRPKTFFRHFRSMWLAFEVFNLLDIDNTISFFWIRDITNRRYAVPNYLTPRLFNLKFVMQF